MTVMMVLLLTMHVTDNDNDDSRDSDNGFDSDDTDLDDNKGSVTWLSTQSLFSRTNLGVFCETTKW